MKRIFLIFTIVGVFLFMGMKCKANEISQEKIYEDIMEQSGANDLSDYIPQYAKDYIEDFDLVNPISFVEENMKVENIFDILSDFFKNNIRTPLITGCAILCLIMFSSAISGTYEDKLLHYVTNVSISAVVVFPAVSVVRALTDAIISSGTFMLAFVPIFAVLIVYKGKPLTSVGFSGVMTIAVQTVTSICSYFVVPLSCMQLAVGVSSSFSGDIKPPAIATTIKRISTWGLTFICTVFLCVLGIQTAINSPADNLYSKTAKFVLGSTVPIVGNVVSEALNTVLGSIKLLNSTVAIYAVLAVALILLPVLIQIIVWRLVIWVTQTISDMLLLKDTALLLKAVDQCFAMILGVTVLMFAMFIISIAVVAVV